MSYLGITGPTSPKQSAMFCKGIVCKCGTCVLGVAFLTMHWPHGGPCGTDRRQVDACDNPPAVRHQDHIELGSVNIPSGGNQQVQMPINNTSSSSVSAALTSGDTARFLKAFKTGVLVYTPPTNSSSEQPSTTFFTAVDPNRLSLPITVTNSGSNFGSSPPYGSTRFTT